MSANPLRPPLTVARAVADAPAEAVAERAEELARRWTLALLGARPLSEMVAVPLEDLARHAPALFASVARALCSDRELARLAADARAGGPDAAPAGALAIDVLCADWSATVAVANIESLRGVLWQAALEELRDPTPRQVADLADRLASVCAALLGRALAAAAGAARPAAHGAWPAAGEQVLYSAPGPVPGEVGAVLIDERDQDRRGERAQREPREREQAAFAGGPGRAGEASPSGRPRQRASGTGARPLPWETPLQSSAATPPGRAEGPASGSEDPVMRVSRGPGAPADGRS